MYAKVIVGRNTPEIDRVFDYAVPPEWITQAVVGARVVVPFGRRNAKTEGYIISLSDLSDVPQGKMKQIHEVLDGGRAAFTEDLLELALWMKTQYLCTLNQCLQLMIPSGMRTRSTWAVSLTGKDWAETRLSADEEAFLTLLAQNDCALEMDVLEEALRGDVAAISARLIKKGFVKQTQKLKRSDFIIRETRYSLNTASDALREMMEKSRKDKRLEGQRRVIAYLELKPCATAEELRRALGITDSPIKSLLKKSALIANVTEERRDVVQAETVERAMPFQPTAEQRAVLSAIQEEWHKKERMPILLHGITGSGKTEIYLRLIDEVLKQGRQAIVLVPEISLTPQILERFVSRFGSAVSITHSRLSQGERVDQWRKARDGEISVMIGPRSALFAPFCDLGAVIIDEFHESSYVSDTTPKYDAREVAMEIAKRSDALLIMGSATPEVSYYYRAQQGEFRLLEMKERTGGGTLPKMDIVDMRRELSEGNRSPFSSVLQEEIRKNLNCKEQTMLFLNRRGYATFVSCRSCGHVIECEACGISYTHHAKEKQLRCHYCGKTKEIPSLCPDCGSKHIRFFGTGTQKIEEAVRELFPHARVLRMDMDTTAKKDSYQRILRQFAQGEADILIGTQMIAKGHDFPNVTLVGVMAADLSLHIGGYRASEVTFQLLTQVGGRAGRGALPGRVLIQTYQSENGCIQYASRQDYNGFYQEEVSLRKILGYPPFYHFAQVLIRGEDAVNVKMCAQKLAEEMEKNCVYPEIDFIGAADIGKLRGDFRWQILLRGADEGILSEFVQKYVAAGKKNAPKAIWYNITRNPLYIV